MIVNSAAINIGVQVSLFDSDLYSFRYMLMSDMAGSYGSSNFSFFQDLSY
jgi:hypothetical protein